MPDLSGQSIGRYHIVEQLGYGGMATVYKAYDTRLERDVAIKVIRRQAFSPEVVERMLKRFEREAKALAKLNHPNIVSIYDYGEYEESPYLVMPFIPGKTLKHMLTGQPIPWQQAVHLVLPIARALFYAHSEGIIHRDVKPANILITQSGEPMLSDFGVAKILDIEESNTLTGTNVGVGTPEYMAPEQWMNKVVPQTDIYALGVVLYEMLTGRKPYVADTPAAVLIMQSSQPLPHPQQYVPDLPEGVGKVLYKAMAKEPGDRYANMGEFVVALEGLIEGNEKTKSPVTKESPAQQERETIDKKLTPPESARAGNENRLKGKGWVIGIRGVILLGILCLVMFMGPLNKMISQQPKTATSTLILSTDIVTNAPIPPTETSVAIFPTKTTAPTLIPTLGVGSTRLSEKDGMLLMYVPAGKFEMGPENSGSDESQVHMVYLDAYWIDQTEITNRQFAVFVTASGYTTDVDKIGKGWVYNVGTREWEETIGVDWKHPQGANSSLSDMEEHPVVQVNWNDASAFCRWAGRRLPTEAEWEKAARGTDGRTYPWGNHPVAGNLLNMADKNLPADWSDNSIDDGYRFTAPVGSYPMGVSPYGTLDMAGNVWEWVVDWYSETYYNNFPTDNPQGPSSGDKRVLRGGSWGNTESSMRSSNHDGLNPDGRTFNVGFRCAMSAVQ